MSTTKYFHASLAPTNKQTIGYVRTAWMLPHGLMLLTMVERKILFSLLFLFESQSTTDDDGNIHTHAFKYKIHSPSLNSSQFVVHANPSSSDPIRILTGGYQGRVVDEEGAKAPGRPPDGAPDRCRWIGRWRMRGEVGVAARVMLYREPEVLV
jgi:hypothetical protein